MRSDVTIQILKDPDSDAGYDWREAFRSASENPVTRCIADEIDDSVSLNPVEISDVVRVVAAVNGEGDGEEWVGVFELADGRFAVLTAWCDYTGWGCRDGGEIVVASTEARALRFCLTSEQRERLEVVLD